MGTRASHGIDPSDARRDDATARRARLITGVSSFLYLDEVALVRPKSETPPRPGRAGTTLRPRRYAEPYESQRDRSDAFTSATGHRPLVFVVVPTRSGDRPADQGPRRHAAARAVADLFATGGIETLAAAGSPAEVATAFSASGAVVACVCGPDPDGVYTAILEDLGAYLVQVGPDVDAPALLRKTFDRVEGR